MNQTKTSSSYNSKSCFPLKLASLYGQTTWICLRLRPTTILSNSIASALKLRKSSNHNKPNPSKPWLSAPIVTINPFSSTPSLWLDWRLHQIGKNLKWRTDFISRQCSFNRSRVSELFEVLRAGIHWVHALPKKLAVVQTHSEYQSAQKLQSVHNVSKRNAIVKLNYFAELKKEFTILLSS